MPSTTPSRRYRPPWPRLLPALVATLFLLLAIPSAADACGYWSLRDVERGRVTFLVHNVTLRGRLLFTIWGTSPRLHAVDSRGRQVISPRGHETTFDFEKSVVRHRGKGIGKLIGSALTIGKERFELQVRPTKGRGIDGASLWAVNVKYRGKTLVHGRRAMSFLRACSRGRPSRAREQQEVRQRIALYLAWRTLRRAR